jgi:hypothetical protein
MSGQRSPSHLNQTTEDWHGSNVTLSPSLPLILSAGAKRRSRRTLRVNPAKGFSERFFALLRMTRLSGRLVKCTNVVCFDLAPTGSPKALIRKTCKRPKRCWRSKHNAERARAKKQPYRFARRRRLGAGDASVSSPSSTATSFRTWLKVGSAAGNLSFPICL